MKIYKNLEQLKSDIKDGVLVVNEDVTFEFSFSMEVSLKIAGNINARDITAGDINVGNINACDIKACDIKARDIKACDIKARNINARDINAGNINARDITAGDINARDINAINITARDITAWDITAGDINARDITAGDITARDITAQNILYYAFCCVYNSIKCISIKAKREKFQEPICLDGKLEFKKEVKETIKIGNREYNKLEVEKALENIKSIN